MIDLLRALRSTSSAALLGSLACTGALSAQTLQAHYPLLNDLLDATGSYAPITLTGNPTPPNLPSNGVCVNGIYSLNPNGQDVRTPLISSLTMSDFQFEVEFELASLPAFRDPILMGGHSYRWLGIYVDAAGTIGLKHNNSNYAWSTTTVNINQWYSAAVKYEAGDVQLILDGFLVLQLNVGPLNDGNNLNFTTNDFSNALSHHGCIRNLKISNDTDLAFHRTETGCGGLTLTEGGNPTPGGSVSFTVGGPFATSAILFGFTGSNVPLCPQTSPCVLGLVSAGSIPGPTAMLSIQSGVPPGATVGFQAVALAQAGCNLGGSANLAVSDTISVVIQ